MTAEDVYARINELLSERNWTLYKLADVCDLPRSSLYNMMERNNMPSLPTLETICGGMGISLSDFFIFASPSKDGGYLSENELKLLEVNRTLPSRHQEILLTYAIGMADALKAKSEEEAEKTSKKKRNRKSEPKSI